MDDLVLRLESRALGDILLILFILLSYMTGDIRRLFIFIIFGVMGRLVYIEANMI